MFLKKDRQLTTICRAQRKVAFLFAWERYHIHAAFQFQALISHGLSLFMLALQRAQRKRCPRACGDVHRLPQGIVAMRRMHDAPQRRQRRIFFGPCIFFRKGSVGRRPPGRVRHHSARNGSGQRVRTCGTTHRWPAPCNGGGANQYEYRRCAASNSQTSRAGCYRCAERRPGRS